MSVQIHATAIVSPEAEIGENVVIGPYSVIDGKVSIGSGTVLGAFVRVMDFVSIGVDCRIWENSVLGGEPQDHDFKGEESWVRIGDEVVLREAVTVNRASGEGNETFVGDRSMLMEGVHVAHNVRVGKDVTIANKSGLSGYSSLGDGTVMSGLSGLHQFVSVGKYCMIGGASKVVKDVPHYAMVDGHPAKVYGLNVVGLRRAGFTSGQRLDIKRAYRTLYRSGLTIRDATALLREQMGDDPLIGDMLDFIDAGKRGLCPWARR